MQIKPLAFALILLLPLSFEANACRPMTPDRDNRLPVRTIASQNGYYKMKIQPAHYIKLSNGTVKQDKPSVATIYKTQPNGKLQPIWSVSAVDWGNALLDNDGVHVVQINSATSMQDQRALVIYKQGKPFKRYSPKTFMPTFKQLRLSTCGTASWVNASLPIELKDGFLSFFTINGKKWKFDIQKTPTKPLN